MDDKRVSELERAMKEMAEHYWRFQGRINALEIVSSLAVFNLAKTQPNPFQWVQDYVEAMRITSRGLIPDVDDQNKGARLKQETRTAIDEFLEQLVRQAGQLKGAPGNQK